jgi:beta-lactamase regulating signal transducer with metallopeptidase domain
VRDRIACALFWFHPLVWFAFARLREEAERAADDCVLSSGISVIDYAGHLLALARHTIDVPPNVAVLRIVTTTRLQREVSCYARHHALPRDNHVACADDCNVVRACRALCLGGRG